MTCKDREKIRKHKGREGKNINKTVKKKKKRMEMKERGKERI